MLTSAYEIRTVTYNIQEFIDETEISESTGYRRQQLIGGSNFAILRDNETELLNK